MWSKLKEKKKRIFEERNFQESLVYLFVYLMNKITYTEVFKMMVLEEKAARAFPQAEDGFDFLEIKPLSLKDYSYNTKRLDDAFLIESQQRGDYTFISLKPNTDEVVSYGWYTQKPMVINPYVELSFPKNYVYMFNGFTEPAYRGYRLHGRGMALYALKMIDEHGKKGLVSYVNAENYRSLHSCARLGYRIIGTIVAVEIFRKIHVFSFGECAAQGVAMKGLPVPPKNPVFQKAKH